MTAPQFEALARLQEVDTDLDRARHRRRTLPALAEQEAVAAGRRELLARRTPAVAARDEVAARLAALEGELAHTEHRRQEVSDRLYGGSVTASRDLQALAADIDVLGARASDLEDRAIEVLEEREPLDRAVELLDAEAAELDRRADAAGRDLAAQSAEVDELLAGLEAQRASAAASVPADLDATYERLRTRLGGVGAARLEGSRCGGCHLDLAATELDALRHEPDDAVVTCEQCGRILIRP